MKLNENKVLIVDDDEVLLECLVKYLKDNLTQIGIIDTAINGIDALEKVKEEYYAVIITGIMMPGMDSLEFYNSAVQVDSDMKNKIIFMSGNFNLNDGNKPLVKKVETITQRWLRKPFKVDDLIRMIGDILRS